MSPRRRTTAILNEIELRYQIPPRDSIVADIVGPPNNNKLSPVPRKVNTRFKACEQEIRSTAPVPHDETPLQESLLTYTKDSSEPRGRSNKQTCSILIDISDLNEADSMEDQREVPVRS